MPETASDEDAWVASRLSALERANRRLWAGLGALAVTLVGISITAVFAAARIDVPGFGASGRADGTGATLVADDVTVRGALRVVDEAGRNLVFIGREPASAGSSASSRQAVIGLFAGPSAAPPTQTVRLATSALGSALSLSTPDGASSSSIFAGADGASFELRRGEKSRQISERDAGETARFRKPESVSGNRIEGPAIARGGPRGSERGEPVDLNDPALQPIGDGLYVGRLSISDQSGVLRVQGRIVNASSVGLVRAEFRLTVAGRERPFGVGRIEAGSSSGFTVEIPSSSAASLREAHIRWVRSTLSYLSE